MMQGSEMIASLGRFAHTKAREGQWAVVFDLISKTPNLVYQTDSTPVAKGWSFVDHAVYQCRLDVVLALRNPPYNIYQQPQSGVILYHAHNQHWPWILHLLKENLLSVNVIYLPSAGKRATLLDMVTQSNLKEIANLLRSEYQAKTAGELDELAASEQLFKAAKQKEWQVVYAMLDNQTAHVDSLDRWVNHGWVLVQHAYAQKNAEAFLKLINQYGASLDEIKNDDKLLHEALVEFYEKCTHDETERLIAARQKQAQAAEDLILEQLTAQLDVTLNNLNDDDELPSLEASVPALLISPKPNASASTQAGIHLLNTEQDPIIPRKQEKRVPWDS